MFKSILIFTLLFIYHLSFSQVSVDATYANNGVLQLDYDQYEEIIKMKKLPNGDVLALVRMGHQGTPNFDMDFGVLKTDATGNLINSFGVNGLLRGDFSNYDYSLPVDFEVLADGKIVVLGRGNTFSIPLDHPFVITKFTTDGKLDSTFNHNGTKKVYFLGISESPRSITIAEDGDILVAGSTSDSSGTHGQLAVIAKIKHNGMLDSTFGSNGKIAIDLANGAIPVRHISNSYFTDVIAHNGKVYGIGGNLLATTFVSYVVRFTDFGELDTTFIGNGQYIEDLNPGQNNNLVNGIISGDTLFTGIQTKSSQLLGLTFCFALTKKTVALK